MRMNSATANGASSDRCCRTNRAEFLAWRRSPLRSLQRYRTEPATISKHVSDFILALANSYTLSQLVWATTSDTDGLGGFRSPTAGRGDELVDLAWTNLWE
jgi:hypothetical protein